MEKGYKTTNKIETQQKRKKLVTNYIVNIKHQDSTWQKEKYS
jgi:hypothetical protein